MLPGGTKLIAGFINADAILLEDFVSRMIEQPDTIALMGAVTGTQAIYVFDCSCDVDVNMGILMRESAYDHSGKVGGKPDFAQDGGNEGVLETACSYLRKQP